MLRITLIGHAKSGKRLTIGEFVFWCKSLAGEIFATCSWQLQSGTRVPWEDKANWVTGLEVLDLLSFKGSNSLILAFHPKDLARQTSFIE